MIKLSEKYSMLEATLPVLADTLVGKCCEKARMKTLSVMLNDLFEELKIRVNKKNVGKRPKEYFKELRKTILEDTSLSNEKKIKLIKLMTP